MKKKQFTGVKCPACETDFGVPAKTIQEEECLFCPVCETEVDTDRGTEAFASTRRDKETGPDVDEPDDEWEEDEDEEWLS